MLENFINRNVEIYVNNGLVIKGCLLRIENDFCEVAESGIYDSSLISFDNIVIIRRYNEEQQNKDNPIRFCAKVSKKQDYSMPLLGQDDVGCYKQPSFIRETKKDE